MPLDPQVQAVLTQIGTAAATTLAEEREAYQAMRRWQGPPHAVAAVADREAPSPAGPIPVRIYTPLTPAFPGAPPPVLVFFHGGGWVKGGIEIYEAPCRALAGAAGCLLVSVEYRWAPEHPFPAGLDDCDAALRWTAAHAAELGGDPRRLGVAGDSAGGNLAAALALRARDQGGPALAFQLLIYPALDRGFATGSYREFAEGYGLTRAAMQRYWSLYLAPDAGADDPLACPLRAADLRGLPPACILTAEYDVLRDEGEAYAARLDAAGVPVRLRRFAGLSHSFLHMLGAVDAAKAAVDEAGAWLRETAGA